MRHYSGRARDYWSIQTDTIEGRRETIRRFLRFALEQGIADRHQEAFIVGYDDGKRSDAGCNRCRPRCFRLVALRALHGCGLRE